jgi:hypothetical protein
MFLIAPGIGTLRRAQVAGPSPGQVPQILWMITRRNRNQCTHWSQRGARDGRAQDPFHMHAKIHFTCAST